MTKSVEIGVGNVKLTISFNTPDELTTALGEVEEIKKILKERLPEASAEPVKIMREELKDICDVDGKYVIFKKSPYKKIDKVMLAIYAYGTSASVDEIRRTTGILDPSGDVINPGASRKYFLSLGKKIYGLSDLGIQTVTEKIIPELRVK
jgi:predicted small secreted protein